MPPSMMASACVFALLALGVTVPGASADDTSFKQNVSGGQMQAQVVSKAPQGPRPSTPVQGTAESGAAIVDRLLAPGSSDPDVPLPKPGLAAPSANGRSSDLSLIHI